MSSHRGRTGRAVLLVVCAAGVALAAASPASAAAFNCPSTTTQPAAATLRSDGLSELAPDIVVTCTGGTPATVGSSLPTVNLSVFLNTAVTSRLLATGVAVGEMELIVDDPSPGNRLMCTSNPANIGAGCPGVPGKGGPASYDGSAGHPNVFGGIVFGNSVTFFGIPIDQPGAGRLTMRIVNLRVNAAGLNGPALVASLMSSGSASLPLGQPTVTAGTLQPPLSFSLLSPDGSTVVSAGPSVQACGTSTPVATLRVAESGATAFRTRTVAGPIVFDQDLPGVAYNSESGFFDSFAPSPFDIAGLADAGTRVQFNFTGPAGTRITLPTSVGFNESGGGMRLAQNTLGPFVPVPGTSAQLTLTGGQASATYEVTGADASQVESADIPVSVTAPAGTTPAPLTATAELAPQSTVAAASTTAPVPRFKDAPTPSTIATVVACPPVTPAVTVVTVHGVSLTHKRFALARGKTALTAKAAPRGTTFRYTLSGTATVKIAISQIVKVHGKRTPRLKITLIRHGRAGANQTPFTGRTSTRTLRPGSYVASVTATNSAGTSVPQTVAFTIVP